MSAYQIAVRTLHLGMDLARLRHRFWQWWLGLYAQPPRKLPPML